MLEFCPCGHVKLMQSPRICFSIMRMWDQQSQGQRDQSQTGYCSKLTTHFCGCAAGRNPCLTTFWEMGWVEHELFSGSGLRESWRTNPSISALGVASSSQEILASSFFNLAFISVISLDSSAFLVDVVSAFARAFLVSSDDRESLSETAVIWTDSFPLSRIQNWWLGISHTQLRWQDGSQTDAQHMLPSCHDI